MPDLTPKQIVAELDKHIVGQGAAKRAVAIALRNRWRRMRLDPALRNEVTPKNILLIGPTGVGKTEIARRLAHLADAPFVKVEATKFTEVGYVGKDVETIVRDLADAAIKQVRDRAKAKVRTQAEQAAEERVLDALLPRARGVRCGAKTRRRRPRTPARARNSARCCARASSRSARSSSTSPAPWAWTSWPRPAWRR